MPEGKVFASAMMLPAASRLTCQQSSMTTYSYPASFMPLLTRASAADLTRSSLTLQAKRFQLFQPIGGVRARPFSRACAGGTQKRIPTDRIRLSKHDFLKRAFISFHRFLVPRFFEKLKRESRSALDGVKTPIPRGKELGEERDSYAVAVAAFAAASAV